MAKDKGKSKSGSTTLGAALGRLIAPNRVDPVKPRKVRYEDLPEDE